MYQAILLDQETIQNITSSISRIINTNDFLFISPSGYKLPHHSTINIGSFDENLNKKNILGKRASFLIKEFHVGNSLGVITCPIFDIVTVDNDHIKFQRKHPHVTVALKNGFKPYISNTLLESGDATIYNFQELILGSGTIKTL